MIDLDEKKFSTREMSMLTGHSMTITVKGIVNLCRELSHEHSNMNGCVALNKLADALDDSFLKIKP